MNTTFEHQRRIDGYFDANAWHWRDLYRENTVFGVIHQQRHAIALRWINQLNLPVGAKVLDIGCGAGLLALELRRRGYVVTGIDASEAMVHVARAEMERNGLRDGVSFEVGDAHALEGPIRSLHVVVALGVIPFLHSPDAVIARIGRLLESGGYFLLSADNCWRLTHLIDPWFTPPLRPVKTVAKNVIRTIRGRDDLEPSVTRHSGEHVERLLASCGFSVVKRTTLGFGPFSLFNRKLFSEATSIKLHQRLQALADADRPVLRITGAQHLVLARR